jgi:hypothetical protein
LEPVSLYRQSPPFSEPIDKKKASKKLLLSMDAADRYHNRNEYLDYPVIRKMFDGLDEVEHEQLLDHIISLYLPVDREKLLEYYKSYEDMVIAINANTGSEYDIDEFFDPESHQDLSKCWKSPAIPVSPPIPEASSWLPSHKNGKLPRHLCE